MPELAPRATRLFALFFILQSFTQPTQAATPSTRPTTPITFLNQAQGQLAILDESTDPYFKLLQPKEIWAKTGRLVNEKTTEAEQDECRRRYQQAVTDFTPAEMTAVGKELDFVSQALNNALKSIGESAAPVKAKAEESSPTLRLSPIASGLRPTRS